MTPSIFVFLQDPQFTRESDNVFLGNEIARDGLDDHGQIVGQAPPAHGRPPSGGLDTLLQRRVPEE